MGEDTVTALKKSVLKKNNDLFKYKIITKNRYVRLQQLVDLDLEHWTVVSKLTEEKRECIDSPSITYVQLKDAMKLVFLIVPKDQYIAMDVLARPASR